MDFFVHSISKYLWALGLGIPVGSILTRFAWGYLSGGAHRGCKRLGCEANKELSLDGKQSIEKPGQWKIKALMIYPIKSCFPVMLQEGHVIPTGLKYDRQFSFAELLPVSESDREKPKFPKDHRGRHHWKFITQREYPLLARVKTELWIPDEASPTYSEKEPNVANGGCLVVSFPDPANDRCSISFQVPFNPCEARIKQMKYPEETMRIWVDFPQALNMTSEIPLEALSKLKELLSSEKPRKLEELALFRVDSNRETKRLREVYRNAPKKEDLGYQPVIGFADSYPLHMINMASIHDVGNHVMPEAQSLNPLRFRANLYIEGPEAFAEDSWRLIGIGASKYDVSSRTARCKLPNVDPKTGVKDNNEPRRAMDEYRKIDAGCPNEPCLGMQLTPVLPEGEIKVGDDIEVLETGEHFYLKWPEYM